MDISRLLQNEMPGWHEKVSGAAFSETTLLHVAKSLRLRTSSSFLFVSSCHTYQAIVLCTIRLIINYCFSEFFELSCLQFQFNVVFTTSKFVLAETTSYISVCCIRYWQPPLNTMEFSLQRIVNKMAILFHIKLWVK